MRKVDDHREKRGKLETGEGNFSLKLRQTLNTHPSLYVLFFLSKAPYRENIIKTIQSTQLL